jgi:hypothetical protein
MALQRVAEVLRFTRLNISKTKDLATSYGLTTALELLDQVSGGVLYS